MFGGGWGGGGGRVGFAHSNGICWAGILQYKSLVALNPLGKVFKVFKVKVDLFPPLGVG